MLCTDLDPRPLQQPGKDDMNGGNWGIGVSFTFDFLLRQGSQASCVRPEVRLCGWRLEDIRIRGIVGDAPQNAELGGDLTFMAGERRIKDNLEVVVLYYVGPQKATR